MVRDISDEKLTAYVLGELEADERTFVATALTFDADLRRTAAALRNTVELSKHAMRVEPTITLTPAQRAAIETKMQKGTKRITAFVPDARFTKRGTTQTRKRGGMLKAVRALARVAVVPILLLTLSAVVIFSSSLFMINSDLQSTFSSIRDCLSGSDCSPSPNYKPYIKPNRLQKPPMPTDLLSKQTSEELVRPSVPAYLNDPAQVYRPGRNTEAYDYVQDNSFQQVTQHPLSTFAIDVDTASYANVRRFLQHHTMPPRDAVRIEEMINYFSYDYEPPTGETPFAVQVEVADAPWHPEHRLVRIGLKGREIDAGRRPPSNLVFLLDVSGSMRPSNKLPLLKRALEMLVPHLDENDVVTIVVYAGASGLVLPPTSGADQEAILDALSQLQAGGSTNAGAGIQLAYEQAVANFIKGGVNRVILATDGDFNVGVTNRGDLVRLIKAKAQSGVFLTILGLGMGNLKDATLEQLSGKGNGTYAYLDTLEEARKVLVEEMSGTLVTIAKDVKIQVEFNPAQVEAYRLIGYENRRLAAEDFNDDRKDAGEIGAGHTVTALYEIVPPGRASALPSVDPLKYQKPLTQTAAAQGGELLTLKLRYKEPDGHNSMLLAFPVTDHGQSYAAASDDFKFAAAVASFGMLLRDSAYKGTATFNSVLELATEGLGLDRHGYRTAFLDLVRKAKALAGQ